MDPASCSNTAKWHLELFALFSQIPILQVFAISSSKVKRSDKDTVMKCELQFLVLVGWWGGGGVGWLLYY